MHKDVGPYKGELYFSLDVEANGPIPGVNSLLSFGLAAFTEDGPVSPSTDRPFAYGAHLKLLDGAVEDPETMKWWSQQGDAYAKTRTSLEEPGLAFERAISWIRILSVEMNRKPVCVAYPASYDFMWWHWYAHRFCGSDPFGFQAFDCKTAAAILLGTGFRDASKKHFPRHWWRSAEGTRIRHDHDAVNDAVEQGHMFVGILREARQQQEGARVALGIAKAALAGSYKDRVPMLQDLVQTLERLTTRQD